MPRRATRSRCGSSIALRLVVLRGWLAGAWNVRLRFGDSAVDGHGVRASVEGGPVRGELADAHGDHDINLLGPAATSTSSYLPPKLASIVGTARQTTRHSTGPPRRPTGRPGIAACLGMRLLAELRGDAAKGRPTATNQWPAADGSPGWTGPSGVGVERQFALV